MGKLSQDSTLAGLRGKVGGLVVSSNKSGGYVRPWFMPRVPRTAEQSAWVTKWAAWSTAWKDLSGEEQTAWIDASDDAVWERVDWFGQPYQPSGFNLWMIVAAMRDSVGLGLSDTPPTGAAPAGAFTMSFALTTWTSGTLSQMALGSTPPTGGVYVQVETSFVNGAYAVGQNKPYRPFYADEWWGPGSVIVKDRVEAIIGRVYLWTSVWYRWRALSSTCVPGLWQTGNTRAFEGA